MGQICAACSCLALQLVAVRAEVQAQSGFAVDRDLHQCPACGLMEDVLYGGKLVTYWRESAEPVDTGLRFKEVGGERLACPCCGCVSSAGNV
jgi:formate dehydrogenase maturation protein FdhE